MGLVRSSMQIIQYRAVCLCALFLLLGTFQESYALEINGVAYTGLREIAGNLGMRTKWIEKDKVLGLESKWTRMEFEIHKREILLNGKRLFMGYPVAESRNRLYISSDDYQYLIQPILTPQLSGPVPEFRHIVIDPGHGGDDPGARNSKLKLVEKSLTLDLSKRLERELKRHGFTVSLTRRRDVAIPLKERGRIANRAHGDLFLSIHLNASPKTTVSGIETYALTPPMQPSTSRSSLADSDRKSYRGQQQGPWNTLLGYYVQRSMVDRMGTPDRGLKRAQFAVLKELEMPGILIEGGFVSHPSEGQNIGSAAYRDRLVNAIVDGILVYKRTLDRLEERR